MLKLSERLYSLRKERKLIQENTAKELGISLKTYCRYEAGEREPNASVLVRMADFYGVTADYLLGRTEERT
ncbi:XRE family transcriptional regulator [Pseudoflavonifractor sp. 60]|uniref:helix-turn-helix domain-containing protein n=1 Tax=Pseudoflavonifractor sp. 60 TaxID=2304576 RepID=UPI00136BDCB0|nr:helix-turn-helix transcriptional regulator [Pseudoflavonifractor sp. 60]NBI68721.1 XRE family transcriptional regulator [Pseudoflavonifractor sp. 60]